MRFMQKGPERPGAVFASNRTNVVQVVPIAYLFLVATVK